MDLCNSNDCTGCFACMNVCPKNAISAVEGEYGKTVPEIDTKKCVNCGLCRKACPVINKPELRKPMSCLAAWTKVQEDREKSTSGGIAAALYRAVMKSGGVIFGCDYGKNLTPEIRKAESEDDIRVFRGSKYVQSFTGMSYREVREQLKAGRKVLYIGTPCQVSGLQAFLGKKEENLYTVDFICHGVPPVKYLREYVQKYVGNRADRVTFRDSANFGQTSLRVFVDGKQIYDKLSYMDYYYTSFLRGLTYRDNCYNCQYASINRVSDLTIGDFWEINRETLKQKTDGRISLILVNTEQGRELLQMSEELLYTEEREIEEAVAGNSQLKHPSVAPSDRNLFLDNLDKGFEKAVLKTEIGKTVRKYRMQNMLIYRAVSKMKRVVTGKAKRNG